jgi:hypothetical protein
MRRAIISKRRDSAEQIARYLPDNYRVEREDDTHVWIVGEDVAGWTLDGYVIPRLASGLIVAEEVTS